MKPILWLSSKSPLPLEDGGRIATHALVSGLARRGIAIDLLCVCQKNDAFNGEETMRAYGTRSAYAWRRPGSFRTISTRERLAHMLFSPLTPLTLCGFASSAFAAAISKVLCSGLGGLEGSGPATAPDWGIIVYDGLHPAAHAERAGLFRRPATNLPLLLRAHNVEAQLWKGSAAKESNPLLRAFLCLQAYLVERFEKSVLQSVDGLAAISERDRTQIAAPNVPSATVAVGMAFEKPLPMPSGDALRLAFLGRLDWPPNRDGLEWFLKNVWPELRRRRPQTSLSIAGSGDGRFLSAYARDEGIRLLGRIDAAAALYQDAHLMISPLFVASGLRVKAIEAARFGRALISTKLGVDGLPLGDNKSAVLAETGAEWIERLAALRPEECAGLGRAAFDDLREIYSLEATAQAWIDLAENIAG